MRVPAITENQWYFRGSREAQICETGGVCSLCGGLCTHCSVKDCPGVDAAGRYINTYYYPSRSGNSGVIMLLFPHDIEVSAVFNDVSRLTKRKYTVDGRRLFLSIAQNVQKHPRFKLYIEFRCISFGEHVLRKVTHAEDAGSSE